MTRAQTSGSMRFFQSLALSAFLLLAGVSSAWAFEFSLSTSSTTENLSMGDSVTVDVFFDATGLLFLLLGDFSEYLRLYRPRSGENLGNSL